MVLVHQNKIIIDVKKLNQLFSFKNISKLIFPLLAVALVYCLKVENLNVSDSYKLRRNLNELWIGMQTLLNVLIMWTFRVQFEIKTLVEQKS